VERWTEQQREVVMRGEVVKRSELDQLREDLVSIRTQLIELERRVAKLELVEELWQAPAAAGDQDVAP
jgi:BMFP domain-containing protein YqiC